MKSQIYGKGAPLIILHGLFGMGDNWKTLGKKWANNREVHLLDLRNHGKSFHSDCMNYHVLSEDVLKYIAYYQLGSPILLGHSIGGKVAMNVSCNYATKIRSLIILDIAPKSYPSHHTPILSAIKSIPIDRIGSRTELNNFLEKHISDSKICGLISKNSYQTEKGNFAFRFYFLGIEKNYTELISETNSTRSYAGRTLFLRGSDSDYIMPHDIQKIQRLFPRSKIVTIPKSGHWLHVDKPKSVYGEINVFLSMV